MDLSAFLLVAQQIGLGVASNYIYDVIKNGIAAGQTRQQIENTISDSLRLNGITVTASTVIDALATNGLLSIQGSSLFASSAITLGSSGTGKMQFGNGSVSRTNNTAIHAGKGFIMETNGNAQVRQNPDGSISFHVGPEKKK